ncbi:diguanylate cyclase [Treponema medium]|uniref:histidine kinase N-terminal 7TM domain-containing diguanylate cyclase n=1 Tax=Treponema medium TaxID=58231 RepID=UPI00197ED4D9|nr:diguanylate cyclase [Treponema medium]QSH91219.1 diguanylate cyclase [Treponema medium]
MNINITDVFDSFCMLNAASAFIIAVASLKKSNWNPVFKSIAYLAAMIGFWNLIRFFLIQTHELQLSFIMTRSIYMCIAFSALFLFYYAQSYCIPNFPLLYRRLIAVIPCITCILSITANQHSFFISINPEAEIFDIGIQPFIYGHWFYIHVLYSYALITLSCMLFFIRLFSPQVKNRKAVIAITVTVCIFTVINIIGTFIGQTKPIMLLSLFAHLFSINVLYFLTYRDMDQKGLYLGRKDFFQGFSQPVLIFNTKNELLKANTAAMQFFTKANIPIQRYSLYDDMFCSRFFVPIQSREQTEYALYMQHRATGKVFLCHKKIVVNPQNDKSVGTTIIMYDAGMLGELIQKIEQNAFTDALCGCLNRSCFELRKETIVQNSVKPCLLLVADIDDLKKVNDTFGHNAGDDYIQTCAAILKQAINTPNTLFRIGGDEFVAFIPHCTGTDTATIIKKIETLCTKQKKSWTVSISVGSSMIKNNHTDLMQHFTQADSAMYAHKQKRKQQLAEVQQAMSS